MAFIFTPQYSKVVYRYVAVVLVAVLLAACQRELTQPEPTHTITAKPVEEPAVVVETFLPIDTAEHTLSNHFKFAHASNDLSEKLTLLYSATNFQTKWLAKEEPSSVYSEVIRQLQHAGNHGLLPADYNAETLARDVASLYESDTATALQIATLDIKLSESFLRFLTHLQEGRLGKIKHNMMSNIKMIAAVKTSDELNDVVTLLQPLHEQYARLQHVLAFYQSLEIYDDATRVTIRANEKIKPFAHHVAIPSIRKKLSILDPAAFQGEDLATDSLHYDSMLVDAVKIFQSKHGLDDDGIIGEKTIKFLHQTFSEESCIRTGQRLCRCYVLGIDG